MKRLLVFCFLSLAVVANAQKGKKIDPTKTSETAERPSVDSVMGYALYEGMTASAALEYQLPSESETDPVTGKTTYFKDVKKRNDSIRVAFVKTMKKRDQVFYIKNRKPKKAGERWKLCINIVNKDTNLTKCFNDSSIIDPETKMVLFEKQVGDSIYMLILVEAYNKRLNTCGKEKEAKLYFARWHPKNNEAKWKVKTFSSCYKTITNMTKTPIAEWDKKSVLTISYHKGSNFYDIFFDPEHPEKGIQSNNDSGTE